MNTLLCYLIFVLSLFTPSFVSAQNYLVVDANLAMFGWDISTPLQPGESWQLTCNPKSTGTPLVRTGIVTMPYPFASIITTQGSYTCFMNFVTAGGSVSAPSNSITVTLKNSRLILELP